MNYSVIYLVISLGILTGCSTPREGNGDDENQLIVEKNWLKECGSIPDNPSSYPLWCKCLAKNHVLFPSRNVVSGKIFKNGSGELGAFVQGQSFDINAEFINSMRKITADSSNFSWGEQGTVYTDYAIEFYDKEGRLANKARISYDGMLWTIPLLPTTKWGELTSKGEYELKTLVNNYVHRK